MLNRTRKSADQAPGIVAAGMIVAGAALAVALAVPEIGALAAEITGLDFKNAPGGSQLSIKATGPITVDKQENAQDKQIVLDIQGAKVGKRVSRKLDTSSFDSKVSLISPYSVGENSRIVIQLRENGSATVSQNGNQAEVTIPNAGGAAVANPGPALDQPPAGPESEPKAAAEKSAVDTIAPPEQDTAAASVSQPETAAASGKGNLDTFAESQTNRKYTGRPITLNFRDADLVDVFRIIGEASGFNIILGTDVRGRITLSLTDVPWDQALDVILQMQRLGAERSNNILRIVTLDALTREKQQELQVKQAAEASAPRITRVFPINYATLGDLIATLNRFSTSSASGGAAGSVAPVVQSDNRTNSIIIRDLPENVEKMRKLIEILDTQTPQVQIEGKIVEASEGFSNALGGQFGFGGASGNEFFGGAMANRIFTSVLGTAFPSTAGSAPVATAVANGGSAGITPTLGFLPGIQRLNALISVSEQENAVKVLASPKVVVLNKESANITSGTPVAIPTINATATGNITSYTIVQASLSLQVTPTVTNEGSVLLELSLQNDTIGQVSGAGSAVAPRNIRTKVLVQSGTTLVLGGVYNVRSSTASSGVPWLRKLPLIGALFGQETMDRSRSELFFFITPRILNVKESGLNG